MNINGQEERDTDIETEKERNNKTRTNWFYKGNKTGKKQKYKNSEQVKLDKISDIILCVFLHCDLSDLIFSNGEYLCPSIDIWSPLKNRNSAKSW